MFFHNIFADAYEESKGKMMITYREQKHTEQKTTVRRGIDDVIDMYVFAWFVYSSLPYIVNQRNRAGGRDRTFWYLTITRIEPLRHPRL